MPRCHVAMDPKNGLNCLCLRTAGCTSGRWLASVVDHDTLQRTNGAPSRRLLRPPSVPLPSSHAPSPSSRQNAKTSSPRPWSLCFQAPACLTCLRHRLRLRPRLASPQHHEADPAAYRCPRRRRRRGRSAFRQRRPCLRCTSLYARTSLFFLLILSSLPGSGEVSEALLPLDSSFRAC